MYATKLVAVNSAEVSKWHPDLLELSITVETDEGTIETWPFSYNPLDAAPMTGEVKTYLEAHPELHIASPAELTVADFRLNRRDVRVVFMSLGYGAQAVDTALENLPAGAQKDDLQLAWLEDDLYPRDAQVVLSTFEHWRGIDPTLTAEKVDERWLDIGKSRIPNIPVYQTD